MSKHNRYLYLILGLSVLARLAASLVLGNQVIGLPGIADQISYHTLATRVLNGHGFTFAETWWPATAAGEPTAHWSYLYTFFLTAIYALFGPHPLIARLIQAVTVGILQPYLTYLLAREALGSDLESPGETTQGLNLSPTGRTRYKMFRSWAPLLAAASTAIYIYFVYYSAALMTEAFFITGALASLLLTIRLADSIRDRATTTWRTAAVFGMVLLATVLLRQLFLLVIPVLLLWLILRAGPVQERVRAFAASGLALGIVITGILPFTLFNYTQFDRFVLLNTNAGYVLFWGNHPVYGTQFARAEEMGKGYQKLIPAELRSLDEAALDQALLRLGIEFIVQDPGRYALLSLSRIPPYFRFWPEPGSGLLSNLARVGSFGLFLPFMLLGLFRGLRILGQVGVCQWLRRPEGNLILLMTFCLEYTLIHVLTWTLIRYRLPVDAVLIIFAGLGLLEFHSLAERARNWIQGRAPTDRIAV